MELYIYYLLRFYGISNVSVKSDNATTVCSTQVVYIFRLLRREKDEIQCFRAQKEIIICNYNCPHGKQQNSEMSPLIPSSPVPVTV